MPEVVLITSVEPLFEMRHFVSLTLVNLATMTFTLSKRVDNPGGVHSFKRTYCCGRSRLKMKTFLI